MEIDSATVSIYLGYPGVDGHHLVIRNTPSMFPSSWLYAMLPSFHRSTQFVWFIIAGYPAIISSQSGPTLEPAQLFVTNPLQMECDVWRCVDYGLSAS
jgi:hypothetical protein